MRDRLIRQLAELPSAEPDIARAAHIRMRCHARLDRGSLGQSAANVAAPEGRMSQFWPPLLATLGVAYFTEVIVRALSVYGAP